MPTAETASAPKGLTKAVSIKPTTLTIVIIKTTGEESLAMRA
jgi:hypothetical protein